MTATELGDPEIADLEPSVRGTSGPSDEAPEDAAAEGSGPPPLLVRELVRRRLIAAVLVAVVLAGVWWLYSSPVSSIWYDARQRLLATDFQTAQSRLLVGHAAGILQIPKLGMDVEIVEGTGGPQLRSGPGHVPKSPLPGVRGNSVIVGHRSAWGAPFADLHELHRGDAIAVKTRATKRGRPALFGYIVRKIETVGSEDDRPFGASKDFRLTLVTSAGGIFGTDRLVVVATSGPMSKTALGSGRGTAPPTGNDPQPLPLGIAALVFGLAWVTRSTLGRRHGRLAVAAVITPLVLAGALAVFLEVDLFLPPLR